MKEDAGPDIPFTIPKPKEHAKTGSIGSVEFEKLDCANLKSMPIFVQALDNQWVPRELLGPVFQKGEITPSLAKKLKKLVRSEYVRALIQGQQVLLNRAYLYNSSAVAQDYTGERNPQREIFKRLLEEEVIIPCLLDERTPIDPPTFFGVIPEFQAWQTLCQEVRPRCLRLSWDDRENSELIHKYLAGPFNAFATNAGQRDIDSYLQVFGLPADARTAFLKQLIKIAHFTLDLTEQDKILVRNQLYQEFVSATPNTAERKYDRDKPFAAEIKQLFDLSYNCNLPDALGGYLLTPVDSLPRTALQEWHQAKVRQEINGEEIVELLQRTAFSLVEAGLNIPSLDLLSLRDVLEIRRMDEWVAYMRRLEELLANPLQFADGGAVHVFESYGELTRRMTEMVARQRRKKALLTTWTPSLEIAFEIGGAVLTCLLTSAGPVFQIVGAVAASVAGKSIPVVGKLIIRDVSEKRAQQDLSTSIDFMRCHMRDVGKQWREIEQLVRTLPGFQERNVLLEQEEIVDPTLNYQEVED